MEQPTIKPLTGKIFRIASEYVVDRYVISEGFEYDLASVPRLLWGLLPPFGLYLPACTVHDYLYRYHAYKGMEFTRKEADKEMFRLSVENNVKPTLAYLMYIAVRIFGKKRWENNIKQVEGIG